VRGTCIIAASQRIECLKIAAYGKLATWQRTLGEDEIVSVLEATLFEEKDADKALTEKAYRDINFMHQRKMHHKIILITNIKNGTLRS